MNKKNRARRVPQTNELTRGGWSTVRIARGVVAGGPKVEFDFTKETFLARSIAIVSLALGYQNDDRVLAVSAALQVVARLIRDRRDEGWRIVLVPTTSEELRRNLETQHIDLRDHIAKNVVEFVLPGEDGYLHAFPQNPDPPRMRAAIEKATRNALALGCQQVVIPMFVREDIEYLLKVLGEKNFATTKEVCAYALICLAKLSLQNKQPESNAGQIRVLPGDEGLPFAEAFRNLLGQAERLERRRHFRPRVDLSVNVRPHAMSDAAARAEINALLR